MYYSAKMNNHGGRFRSFKYFFLFFSLIAKVIVLILILSHTHSQTAETYFRGISTNGGIGSYLQYSVGRKWRQTGRRRLHRIESKFHHTLRIQIRLILSFKFESRFRNEMVWFAGAWKQPKMYCIVPSIPCVQWWALLRDHCSVSINCCAAVWMSLSNVCHRWICHQN